VRGYPKVALSGARSAVILDLRKGAAGRDHLGRTRRRTPVPNEENTMRNIRNALLVVSALSLLGACQPASRSTDAAAEKAKADSIRVAAAVEAGAPVFLQYCAMCHGDGGNGDGEAAAAFATHGVKVARLNDLDRMSKLSKEELTRVVREGGGHTGRSEVMPAWADSLDDAQLSNVVEFISSLATTNPAIPLATLSHYLKAPDGVAAEGRSLFLHHCAACHGNEGKGNGPFAARLATMQNKAVPRNLTDAEYMNTIKDDKLYATISLGGGHFKKAVQMPAWNLVLTPAQMKNLVAYVRTLSAAPAK
jgi:cbb3-type cytochrome c oxidase subunit III